MGEKLPRGSFGGGRSRKKLRSAPTRRAKLRQKTTKKVGWPPPLEGEGFVLRRTTLSS